MQFNAWQYGQESALWRALLSRVLDDLRPAEESDENKKLHDELDDLQASLYGDVDREEAGESRSHGEVHREGGGRPTRGLRQGLRAVGSVGSLEGEEAARIRQRLRSVIGSDTDAPTKRVSAGTALGLLGDNRFRVDAWYLPDEPLLGFVEIPVGPFKMGSDPQHVPSARDEEKDQREIALPAFYMARYPVTVAQFQAFVRDSGVQAEAQRFAGVSNHPVVDVSWHDALAYCDWLTERLRAWDETPEPLGKFMRNEDWRVTLPSEAEWEKAARGDDGRLYPWGDEPDTQRANSAEAGIGGTTSAVGCFPNGASPYGILDLAGNVWEWTRSLYKDYPYPNDETERQRREDLKASGPRVLRGGSFYSLRFNVRCAYRFRDVPDLRYDGVGFRVVVSPFLL